MTKFILDKGWSYLKLSPQKTWEFSHFILLERPLTIFHLGRFFLECLEKNLYSSNNDCVSNIFDVWASKCLIFPAVTVLSFVLLKYLMCFLIFFLNGLFKAGVRDLPSGLHFLSPLRLILIALMKPFFNVPSSFNRTITSPLVPRLVDTNNKAIKTNDINHNRGKKTLVSNRFYVTFKLF